MSLHIVHDHRPIFVCCVLVYEACKFSYWVHCVFFSTGLCLLRNVLILTTTSNSFVSLFSRGKKLEEVKQLLKITATKLGLTPVSLLLYEHILRCKFTDPVNIHVCY